jgi:hypothetical protein
MDLFNDMEESLSPKEKWMRRNSVEVLATEDDHGPKWIAQATGRSGVSREGRDDAIKRLAHRMWVDAGIKPWNMQ